MMDCVSEMITTAKSSHSSASGANDVIKIASDDNIFCLGGAFLDEGIEIV